MKDRLTQFGVKCREFRSRFTLKMGDQAKGLGISVAYISAIERGKRPVPEDYPLEVAQWMSLSEKETQVLRDLASGERTIVKVFPKNSERALLAEDFARDLNGLTPEGVKQLRVVLESCRPGKYSDHEIRERVSLVRAAFSLGEKITFDILHIIENLLPTIDPKFSLQVDPDGSFGEYVQIYSDSDGKTINRFRSTEWLYNSAVQGTEDSRFKLAHELAHWILHRHDNHTFLRLSRPGKVVSKNVQVEYEADFFAREFLMPLAIVEKFSNPKLLARAAQVPLWTAQKRMREISLLAQSDRERIKRLAAASEAKMRSQSGGVEPVALASQALLMPRSEPTANATVLNFPKRLAGRSRSSIKKINRAEPANLPLFDYAETAQRTNPEPLANRSDQWFADFGWRG
jgi:transcriptional regulator with XRE-family HTH domain